MRGGIRLGGELVDYFSQKTNKRDVTLSYISVTDGKVEEAAFRPHLKNIRDRVPIVVEDTIEFGTAVDAITKYLTDNIKMFGLRCPPCVVTITDSCERAHYSYYTPHTITKREN